ncbi:DUF905 family protein [Klebsiella pneumoniae]
MTRVGSNIAIEDDQGTHSRLVVRDSEGRMVCKRRLSTVWQILKFLRG